MHHSNRIAVAPSCEAVSLLGLAFYGYFASTLDTVFFFFYASHSTINYPTDDFSLGASHTAWV